MALPVSSSEEPSREHQIRHGRGGMGVCDEWWLALSLLSGGRDGHGGRVAAKGDEPTYPFWFMEFRKQAWYAGLLPQQML